MGNPVSHTHHHHHRERLVTDVTRNNPSADIVHPGMYFQNLS